jgi:ATP-binding cassette subfamily B protein
MRGKSSLFIRSVSLVWKSAPSWTTWNVLVSLAAGMLPLGLVWLIKRLIDAVTAVTVSGWQEGYNMALVSVIGIAIIYFMDELIQSSGALIRKNQSFRLEEYMNGILHSKAISLDLRHFEDPSYFDILSRASREAPYRPVSIVNNLVSLLRGIVSLLLIAGLISLLNWVLVAVLVFSNIPGIWLRIHYADRLYNFRKELTPEARKSAYFNWLLTGDRPSRELRLFGLGEYFTGLFRKSFTKQKEEEISIIRRRSAIEIVSGLFKAAAAFVVISYLVNETFDSDITIGELAMYLLAFRLGMTYIWQILGSVAGLYEDSLFVSDIFEFLGLKEEVIAVPPVKDAEPLQHSIIAEDLSFAYPGSGSEALSGISIEIKKGETVAIVGPNGAGKSTLVRLLARLYDPLNGKILYDGVDIRHFQPVDYRKQFSILFQDFMLYNLSAGDNITLGNVSVAPNQERMKGAARDSGVDDLISSFPSGYDTVIGRLFDDSRELSWGEWQKIALARALYRDSSVLVLDEPSSALDSASEYELFNRFREIARDRTSILISHHYSNVSIADRIFVLDRGRIIESGTHNELINHGGTYHAMYNQQKNRYR